MQESTIITCSGLTKTYANGVTALDDLTLSIEQGMSFGLMGENGAGKSTLVLVFLAALFFPFMENTAYFFETSIWDLSAIAVLARLTSRAAYSRGLILATALLPSQILAVLSIARIPRASLGVCYNVSVNGSFDPSSLWGFPLVAAYFIGLVLLAGYWLEKKELLLY